MFAIDPSRSSQISYPRWTPAANSLFAAAAAPVPMAGLLQILRAALQAFSQLGTGWGGFAGSPSAPPQTAPAAPPPASSSGGSSMLAAGGLYGNGAYGSVNGPPVPLPPPPTDSQEFASYLQAQRIGGTLEGKTGIAQKDAIPGTRFAREVDGNPWQAAVARDYTYQFAAYASGNDPLTPAGLQAGADAFLKMTPEAQLFTQVASVFKGNLLDGPGFYDNPGLKKLLLSKGLTDLAGKAGVGETDVQSVGAITQAINSGKLTLQEVIDSGTIDNLDRYKKVVHYVQDGGFNQDLNRYESFRI